MKILAIIAQVPRKILMEYPEKKTLNKYYSVGYNRKKCERLEIFWLESKIVVKHFIVAKANDIKPYIIPNLKQNPETMIIHTGTNDLQNDSMGKSNFEVTFLKL